MQALTGLGADEDCQSIGNGVVNGYEFAFEGAETLNLALNDVHGVGLDAVFLQLCLDQGQGQLGANQGDVGAQTQQVGYSTNVVFVAVGQHDSHDVLQAVLDVVEVGQDEVNAGLGLFGEEHATVDNEQFAVDLVDGHVTTDFAQAAQGHNAQGVFFQFGG